VNKTKLSISSLDIIIKLKSKNYADNVPNVKFNSALGTNKLDAWILPRHYVITRQRKQTFGFTVFDNFFKYLLTLKTNHDMQVGFMM